MWRMLLMPGTSLLVPGTSTCTRARFLKSMTTNVFDKSMEPGVSVSFSWLDLLGAYFEKWSRFVRLTTLTWVSTT